MRFAWTTFITLGLLAAPGCSILSKVRPAAASSREFSTTLKLHGKPLELHLAAPRTAGGTPPVLVLYASGDGGWFGAAVDMFREISRSGYYAVGFSSRAFLKIERPRGALVTASQLAAEYELVLARAREMLGLEPGVRTILTGWSRGAAFSVLVGSELRAQHHILGVVAIGLSEGEDLDIDGPDDETDDGPAAPAGRRWPFDTYERIARLGPMPCALIQSTRDNYFPAASARRRFGPDTRRRRLYAVDARNHRFSGGRDQFDAALADALQWIAAPERPAAAQRPDRPFTLR